MGSRSKLPPTKNSAEVERILYAFDFDHTIVHENSDVSVTKLIERPLPEEIKNIYDGTNWTAYMDHVFNFLAAEGITIDKIKEFCQNMKSTPGMEELLEKIAAARQGSVNDDSVKLMIISDANHFFIEAFFEGIGIKPDSVITNPSEITSEGQLRVMPHDNQTMCNICPKNLCKGKELLKYLSNYGPFDKVVYTGDGSNDICPVMKLQGQDISFVRKGYSMEKFLQKGTINGQPIGPILAEIVYWDTAKTIQDRMDLN